MAIFRWSQRAELCDTSGIFKGATALNLKDRDDKGHDAIKKNGRRGRGPPAFYYVKLNYIKYR